MLTCDPSPGSGGHLRLLDTPEAPHAAEPKPCVRHRGNLGTRHRPHIPYLESGFGGIRNVIPNAIGQPAQRLCRSPSFPSTPIPTQYRQGLKGLPPGAPSRICFCKRFFNRKPSMRNAEFTSRKFCISVRSKCRIISEIPLTTTSIMFAMSPQLVLFKGFKFQPITSR